MSNTRIQIKRSSVTTTPVGGSLAAAEPAYSYLSDKLFIGDASGTPIAIGGRYFIDQLNVAFAVANAAYGVANGAYFDSGSNSWVIPVSSSVVPAVVGTAAAGAALTAATATGGGGAVAPAATAPVITPTTPTAPATPSSPVTTPATPTTPVTTPTTPVTKPTTPTTPSSPTTPTTPTTPGGTTTTTPGGVTIHDYSTPYTMPDGTPVDTTGWSAGDIAKALAAGYILNVAAATVLAPKPTTAGYQQQFFPIPTYNASGLVNPGVNPGFVEPSPMYNTGGYPGMDQYYWGQHGYAQTMSDLANLNTNAVNAPATPYGNPNAINLGQLAQFNYPNMQSLAGAYGSLAAAPNQAPLPNMSYDIYNNPVQMNTATPATPGYASTFGPNTQAQQATGHGAAAGYGQGLNYNFTPAQLATVNHSGMTPAAQLTSVNPADLATQLQSAATAAGTS